MQFEPNNRFRLWGYESREISAHPHLPCRIADGAFRGKLLSDVRPDFPLLVKVIDATTRLSVQVHPNEEAAARLGGEAKTEMWCFLDDGVVFAGLKPGVDAAVVTRAVKTGEFEDLLVRHEVKKGEVFLIPAGLVHTIGGGTRLYEIQQSANTTYRLYDWGRLGVNYQPRELHIEEALQSIDFSLPPPIAQRQVSCPYFTFRQETLTKPTDLCAPSDSFLIVYEVSTGVSTLLLEGESVRLNPGLVFLTTKGKNLCGEISDKVI